MSLIKSQLVQNITDQNPHLYIKDVERIINSIFSEITKSLAEGRRVELRGFGAFSVQKRKERIGRNPRTGDAVNVSAKYIPRFKQGKELRIKLNSTNKVDNTFYGKRIEYFAKKLNIFISHNSDGKIKRMSYREADNDDLYQFSIDVEYPSDTDIKIYMCNMYHYLCNICIKELKIVNIVLGFPNVEDFCNLAKICNGEILCDGNKLICETTFANIYKIAKIIRKKYQH